MGRDTAELIIDFTKSSPKRLERMRELHGNFMASPGPETALKLRLALQQIRAVGEAYGFHGVQSNATVIENMLKPFVDGVAPSDPAAMLNGIQVAYRSFDAILVRAIPQRFQALGLGDITVQALDQHRPSSP